MVLLLTVRLPAVWGGGGGKPFLKQKEMAAYLGISVNTLKKLEKLGLSSVIIDGLHLYSKEEAVKFLLQRQN